jgi:hypothetical protein
MLLPNKLFSYNQSIFQKFPIVLSELKSKPLGVHELYKKVIRKMKKLEEEQR